MRPARWILALGLLPAVLPAGDRDFDALVQRIEWQYGTRRLHIPLFGVANFFVKVTRPGGASDLKMAIFENIRYPGEFGNEPMGASLGSDWHPMVRVFSRRHPEWTGIYTRLSGRRMEMLIASFEPTEASVIKLRINPKALQEWVDQPARSWNHR